MALMTEGKGKKKDIEDESWDEDWEEMHDYVWQKEQMKEEVGFHNHWQQQKQRQDWMKQPVLCLLKEVKDD